MDIKLLSIDDAKMSIRSTNALRRAGIHTIGDMMKYDADSLSSIRNLGEKSVSEILEKIKYFKNSDKKSYHISNSGEAYEGNHKLILDYLVSNEVNIDVLDLLSARAYNYLSLNGYDKLCNIVFMSVEELMSIRGIDEPSAKEIEKCCKRYIRENEDKIIKLAEQAKVKEENSVFLSDALSDEKYHDNILTYVKANNIALADIGLSTRSYNKLLSNGYKSMMDMIFLTRDQISEFDGIGARSIHEIVEAIRNYLICNEEKMVRYLNGDLNALISEETLRRMILNVFRSIGFRGLSINELSEKLKPIADVTQEALKKVLGRLIADGELEYVDFRCFKVYTKFIDYYSKCDIDKRRKTMIKNRLAGFTLDQIGNEFSVTRERARQIIRDSVKKVMLQYISETGYELFDEDYYKYLYETYDFNCEECSSWFSVSPLVWIYLDMMECKKGVIPLEKAIKDTNNLDAAIRLRIKNYINRNRIYIDGKWVEKDRNKLEPVVIKKCCSDEVPFAEFVDIYNEFLREADILFDEKLYYTDEILRTRKNRLQESRLLLWKRGERFRYYDIDGQDYSELFEVLDFSSYKDVELSTFKFFEAYPELMKKYDIRDGYELHNLLKKVLANDKYNTYPELKFSKMPTIKFGTPDRDSALFDIMIENAPISMNELCKIIHKEYGYDMKMIPNYIQHIMEYYHNGVFTIDHKDMNPENSKTLLSKLTEDFYCFSEIKKIYKKLFPMADADEVNSYTLKQMGFVVNSNYIIQHYKSAEDYFTDILTCNDIIDTSVIKYRYSMIQTYYSVSSKLKTNLDIIEFEPDKFISIRKLESSGITRQTIMDFCNAVYDFADDKHCFSIQSLKNDGFDNELFEYGFDNLFYGNLLISDERFSRKKLLGTLVFSKEKKDIMIKTFLEEIVVDKQRIDLYELDALLKEYYGCSNYEEYDLVYKTRDASIFYDSELQKFYADQELYYQEIDETGGLY